MPMECNDNNYAMHHKMQTCEYIKHTEVSNMEKQQLVSCPYEPPTPSIHKRQCIKIV